MLRTITSSQQLLERQLILALVPLWDPFQFKNEGWVNHSCLLRGTSPGLPQGAVVV